MTINWHKPYGSIVRVAVEEKPVNSKVKTVKLECGHCVFVPVGQPVASATCHICSSRL